MHRFFIKNRKNQNILVCIDVPTLDEKAPQKGLAFIMPGLGSQHRKPEFRALAEILTRHGYTAISFDPTHSFGESDGLYEDATFTNYASDLEDVIEWASKNVDEFGLSATNTINARYVEPFILIGHSLGAMSVVYYTERFPEKVKALAPFASAISGKLSIEARSAEEIEKWKYLGYQETVRSSGEVRKLKWSHMEDRLKYDLLDKAEQIRVPLLMLVGDSDPLTPPHHQQLLFEAVATPTEDKELHIIKNADHDIGVPETLAQVKEIFEKWLVKIS
jgi:pimeloyl-ACP methyl ester carboxylesterase